MIAILTIVIFIIDILSKITINRYIGVGESVKLVDNFLYFSHVRNTGAAWSMFDNNEIFVLVISCLIILGLIMYIFKNKPKNKLEKIAYGFILGGALGNFANRLVNGYVTDFIDVKIFNYDYPIFNLADIFIVVGVILFAIDIWRGNNGNKSRRR